MLSIVTEILSSTVGLLVNKARDSAAAKLTGGDVTDAKIRELVVRELDDVKTKLDGLSRKDLLSSYSFLKQGIDLLNVSLTNSMDEQKDLDKSTNEQDESTVRPSSVQSEILNEALALFQAMEKLNVVLDGHFDCAKERFKDARRSATYAFSNQALSIEDRLMAAKLHIVATILEYLDSPQYAITSSLSFLKELHGLEAIFEIFSVYFKRGLMSRLNKAERVECVKSVMLINYTLFQFVFKFSREYTSAVAWPTIALDKRSFNPILHWQRVSVRKSMGDELTQLPNRLILDENIISDYFAVNSHGDVFVANYYDGDSDSFMIIPKTGESKVVNLPLPSEGGVHQRGIKGLAVNKNNNVYVLSLLQLSIPSSELKYFVLDVLDENYNIKQTMGGLEYLIEATESLGNLKIAITKNDDIVVMHKCNLRVFVCDNTGKLKHTFERSSHYVRGLSICGQDEIMITSDDGKTIQIYSKEGNLKSTIEPPEGYKASSLAFNYVICKIIVLVYVKEKNSYFLLYFTESGGLETEMFLCKKSNNEFVPKICSHPSGPCVIVQEKNIIFI